jgi:hypothetical protein
MARSNHSNRRPDTLMQDRSPLSQRRLLQRTAGPPQVRFTAESGHQLERPGRQLPSVCGHAFSLFLENNSPFRQPETARQVPVVYGLGRNGSCKKSKSRQDSETKWVAGTKSDAAVRSCAFFETASSGRSISTHRKNEIIFSQGDAADAVFYIKKGKVKVIVVSKQGKEAVVALLGADEFLGEGCLIGQSKRLAAAVTMSECTNHASW